ARTPRPASAGFPDAYHAKRPQPSTWRSATTPAKPDSRSHMSVHFPDGVNGHDGARDEDHRCRDRRKRADEQAVEAPLRERLLREHSDQADAGDREREPDRERDDQNEPEGQPVQRDRREQDDERGWARQQPAGDADGEQALARVMVMLMIVLVSSRMQEAAAQHGDADRDDHHAGDEVDPRIEPVGDDPLREAERHEPEREDADRMCDGDDRAEQRGILRRTALPDQVRSDDRLTVPG